MSVWDVGERELKLKAHLYGHSEPITCLASSPSYNIIVSGSKDLTCIIWDLARLSFVRQLVPHSSPIDAVGVNELTGDIATCDGSWLRLWSVNGQLIGRIDTAGVGGGGGMSHGIICVAFSVLNEWDGDNVVMTGSMDGIVRMWSIRYVQVPEYEARRGGDCDFGGPGGFQKSLSEDSSLVTASDSDPDEIKVALEDKDTMDLLAVQVFDPDKDRDSLEDVHDAVKKEVEVEGKEKEKCKSELDSVQELIKNSEGVVSSPVVVRRQRALSSGTDKQSVG